jgi:hypothetical protein
MQNEKFIARFEVLIVHLLKLQVFWVVTLIVKIMPEVSMDCVPSSFGSSCPRRTGVWESRVLNRYG